MPRDALLPAAGPSPSLRASPQRIETLRAYLRQAERPSLPEGKMATAAFGIPEIDDYLPAGGLVRGALHELMPQTPGDAGAITDFCTALLVRLLKGHEKPVLWCLQNQASDAGDLYPPGLLWLGLEPARLLVVRTSHDADTLWVLEEGLRCGALAAVVGEIKTADLTASRRLQLAAETSGCTALLLRASSDAPEPSAAATRWRIKAAPSRPRGWAGGLDEPGTVCWQASLFRCRGGAPGNWLMEWRDETSDLALAAPLRDRSGEPCDTRLAG
jgi:protein ImuA